MKIRTLLLSLAALAVSVSAYAETMFYATVYNEYGEGAPSGVVKIDEAGVATYWNTTIGGVAIEFSQPEGIALDGSGNVYVNDGQFIYKITPAGIGSIYAEKPNDYYAAGLAIDAAGYLYATGGGSLDANSVSVYRYDLNSGPQARTEWSTGNYAYGLAIGPDQRLYFSNLFASEVYRYTPLGEAESFALVESAFGLTFDAQGNLFVGGDSALDVVYKVTGDGTVVQSFHEADCTCTIYHGLATDPAGNLYIATQIKGEDDIIHNYILRTSADGGTTTTFSTLGDDQRVNSIAQAIPEPSAILLLGLGLVVMLFVWPRVRRS